MKTTIHGLLALLALTASACGGAKALPYYESGEGGFNTRSYYYDDGKEIVVFDTQFTPALAEEAVRLIQAKSQSKIAYVVVSHPNPDKFNAIPYFQSIGAKVIASEKTVAALAAVHGYKKYFFVNLAKMFTEETYPQLGQVDISFDDRYTIEMAGGGRVELHELGAAGVSSNQTISFVPSQKALVVGDLLHHRTHAWLEGPVASGSPRPDLKAWRTTLGELAAIAGDDSLVHGGRGPAAPLAQAVAEQQRYLEKAEEIVGNYLAADASRAAAIQGPKAQEHFQSIQKEFEAAFPDYGLPYMIGYGVYGLALSLAN